MSLFRDPDGESHGDSTARPARKPKPPRSLLERCGARTRTPKPCASCGAPARVNRPCPACGAPMPEAFCQAPPTRDPVSGVPRNGRCRRHGGLSTGARTPEGRERARAALERALDERRARAEERGAQAALEEAVEPCAEPEAAA